MSRRAGLAAPSHASPQAGLELLLAFVLVSIPILVHPASTVTGLVMSLLVGVTLATFRMSVVPVLLSVAFLYQNTFVAMVTPAIATETEFNTIRAHNFVLLAGVTGATILALMTSGGRCRDGRAPVLGAALLLLPFIAFYTGIGLARGLESAPTYLRNIAGPLLCLVIGVVAARAAAAAPERALVRLGWITVVYGYLELVFELRFLSLFNGDAYIRWRLDALMQSGYWHDELRERGFVVRDQLDMLRVTLLNTPLLADLKIEVFRLHGPNFHPISYGYALAILALVGLAIGHVALLAVALPLLVIVGSKGALVLLVVTGGAMMLARIWRGPSLVACVALVLAAFISAAFVVGLGHGDYHVLGLIGSIKGFLANPLGHGIGAGGNLAGSLTRAQWQNAQAAGQTAVALESGIGVLLYQMGLGALPLIAFYGWISRLAWRLWRVSRDPLLAFATFATMTLLTNGLLQEEALFAPLSLGLTMLVAGVAIGRHTGSSPQRTEWRAS